MNTDVDETLRAIHAHLIHGNGWTREAHKIVMDTFPKYVSTTETPLQPYDLSWYPEYRILEILHSRYNLWD